MRMPVEMPMPELDLLDVQVWHVYWARLNAGLGRCLPVPNAHPRLVLSGRLTQPSRTQE